VIRKAPFLIWNRHFLIRKGRFAIHFRPYVAPVFGSRPFFLYGDTPMIRRKLLVAAAIIVSVVLTACADATGPKEVCPTSSGSGVCRE
jgi:hypothetical protein